ncbi:hypothetical protein QVD17_41406 [Tagetes erecta]|uniref:Transposase-associated domain-containing protein n=1 Tax=Tagetes erecta TaxID=13708 RepID=A0AAD8JKK2_TARER|nr:hypothetical protein QVD17_41406 [Tagetes erecta]
MNLDKSWTKITNKVDPLFIKGAMTFAERGKTLIDNEGLIHCPCRKCGNVKKNIPTVVGNHIILNGFDTSYNEWVYHGEHISGFETEETDNEGEETENESSDGVNDLLDDAFRGGNEADDVVRGGDEAGNAFTMGNKGSNENLHPQNNPNVEKLFVDMEKPLYPGKGFTRKGY